MKKIFKTVLLAAFVMSASAVSAQKMGRINVQAVVVAMPETATMQKDLETIQRDFASNLETMQVELNNKIADFQKNQTTMNESLRSLREKEMQDLTVRMQQFEQNAMKEIQLKQAELLEPILNKAREAVASVSKAGAYDVIFDESAGALAYYNEAKVTDITKAVQDKLGIKPAPAQ